MSFLWPPIVTDNTDASSFGYFFSDVNQSFGGILYNPGADTYYGFVEDHVASNNHVRAYGTISTFSGSLGTSGTTLTGADTGTLTTDDGITLTGGDPGPAADFRHCRSPDFTGGTAAWGTVQENGSGDGRGFLLVGGQRWANTTVVPLGNAVGAVQGSNTEWFCFVNQTLNGMMSQSPAGSYLRFNTATNTFDNLVELFSPGHSVEQILDAGEGYYYLITKNGANVEVYGADMTAGTVTLTSVLATFTSSGGVRTENTRYVTVGANRVLGVATTTHLITITFTSGTKTTPTIASQAAAMTGIGHYTVEYDPGDTSDAYIVGYATSGVGSGGWQITAAYAPFSAIASGWQGQQVITTVTGANGGGTLRAQGFGSAQNGEATKSVGMQGYSQTFGNAYTLSTLLKYWHTPVNYERNVEVASTYTSVSAGVERIRLREVAVDAFGYGSVDVGFALAGAYADDYEWELSATSIITVGVDIDSTYSSVALDAEVLTLIDILDLEQYWPNCGYTFMNDFMTHLNSDRSANGVPAIKAWGDDGKFLTRPDIATYHATQMGFLGIWAHDDSGFWPGWRYSNDRIEDRMAALYGLENLQRNSIFDLTTDTDQGYPTAYELWQQWEASPGHHGNMIYNWGADNDKVYSVLGFGDGWYSAVNYVAGDEDFAWSYACNNFVVLETLMFEIDLPQTWDNTGALVALLKQQWANDAWVPVDVQFEAPYGIRVAAQMSAPYEYRTAAQLVVPIYYSITASLEFPYEGTEFITPAQHEAPYAIKNTETVVEEHEAGYALLVSAALDAGYALLGPVAAQSEAGYGINDTEPVAAQHEGPYGLLLAAQLSSPYTIHLDVVAQHESPYGDVVQVAQQHEARFALADLNPVLVAMTHYYFLEDYAPIFPTNTTVTLTLPSGLTVRVDDGVIENSEGDIGYTFECSLTDLSVYAQIKQDDQITVNFCGEVYTFFVDTKSINRDGPSAVGFRLSATNATARLGSPYAQEIDYVQGPAAQASALVDDLTELSFSYEIADWAIPSGRLQVSRSTPLEIIRQIAEAPGGVVDAEPDGSMRLHYPYPVAMNKLASASLDHVYSDNNDNLSVRQKTIYRDAATRLRVREGEANFADVLVWVADEEQRSHTEVTGYVYAYLSPYRKNVTIKHLGNATVFQRKGELSEELEELVEFREGVANTSRPVHSLQSVEWYTDSLGSVTFSLYSTTLNAGLTPNLGYGLAKVKYTTKYLSARVVGVPVGAESGTVGPPSAYGYFILEDSNG